MGAVCCSSSNSGLDGERRRRRRVGWGGERGGFTRQSLQHKSLQHTRKKFGRVGVAERLYACWGGYRWGYNSRRKRW